MKVAMMSYEVFPFAKVGGLADVIGSLPKYLERNGVEVDIFMPYHRIVDRNSMKYGYEIEKVFDPFEVPYVDTDEKAGLYKTKLPGSNCNVYLIANENIFNTEEVYGKEDPALQSVYFSAAAIAAIKELDERYDVIHANDWHTGLVPVYLKSLYKDDNLFHSVLSVYTIHNLGYQGRVNSRLLNYAGLPHYLFNVDALEFYGDINFMKGGILFSDIITTVSPTYAQEIQTSRFGEHLEGVLSIRSESLYGILNGIDYEVFSPENREISLNKFSADNLNGKYISKAELQKRVGLPQRSDVPVIGIITRLVSQKGLDIFSKIANLVFMQEAQMVLLGTGQPEYEEMMKALQEKYPERVSANIEFDIDLANHIYVGSDMFLMPSKYEPCGLGQLFSLRMGTVPIVHYTGGLADTVREYNAETGEGNGFGFSEYRESELLYSMFKALYAYKDREQWNQIIQNAMSDDFSWERSAREYLYVYEEGINKKENF
ncbi:MAG TPA: glycogen/starch synthase [Thermotogota bacterium]|nr:glycogen/starch synthase [Thermotogota bacterium]HPJ88647.1 glycogen/starch synthase [Thermotogota bacterium]HPR95815.1 glycogen/starch synthase [Thermotogota bacterium]